MRPSRIRCRPDSKAQKTLKAGSWRPPPEVDLPAPAQLAPMAAGLPVAGPQMLARHLASGAFAMTDTRQMQQMERVLEEEGRRNVKRIELIPRHPLFHAFFDIDAHTFEGMGVGRLYGLEIDGRLAAIGGLSYRVERTPDYNPGGSIGRAALKPHLANLLYINALAYGLVQPSALGGRYLDKVEP